MVEDERLVDKGEQEEDMWQYSLRPRYFKEYIGQEKAKKICTSLSKRLSSGAKPLTMFSSMDRLALVKPP